MKTYKTINSFTQIPSPAQIISYLLFILQIVVFWVIIQNRYNSPPTRIAMIVVYTVSVLAHVLATFLASISDPSDSFMVKYRNHRDLVKNSEIGHMLYCDLCRSYVQLTSRHCRACGRCVQKFDHHCMWINNCVGGNNYKIFLVMIVLTFLNMTTFLISACLLWSQHQYEQFMAEMAVVWATSIIVLVFVILIFNLILLHIYLNYLGITTYEFILRNKQREKESGQSKKISHVQEMTQEGILGNSTQQKFKEAKLDRIQELKIKNRNNEATHQIQQIGQKKELSNHSVSSENNNHSEASDKNLTAENHVQGNPQKVYPTGIFKQTVFEVDQISNDSHTSKESVRISEFFSRNKSLSIFVKSDVIIPEASSFPKTCKNPRTLAKIQSRSSK